MRILANLREDLDDQSWPPTLDPCIRAGESPFLARTDPRESALIGVHPRSILSFLSLSEPGEAGVGVAEAVELDAHAVHDRQVEAAELAVLVPPVVVVHHARRLDLTS